MSKSWVIGDWAAEAERAEEEEKARAAAAAAAAASAAPHADSFSARSRKKKQTFSISEFTTGRSVSHGTRRRDITDSRGFTAAQGIMMLPTGPGDRSGEQDQYSRLGGAFHNHRGGGDYRGVSDRLAGGQGYGGRPENDRMVSGFLHDRERIEPSRADGSSDWNTLKRATASQVGGHVPDGEKRGPRQGHPDLPPSRADGVEKWGLVKRSLPLAPPESRPARRNEETRQVFRADEPDDWTLSKKTASPPVSEAIRVKSRADEAVSWLSFKTESHAQESRAASDRVRTMPQQQQAAQNLQRRPVVLAPQVRPRNLSPFSGMTPLSGVMNADFSSTLPPKPKSNQFGSVRSREEVITSRDLDDKSDIDTKEQGSRLSSSQSSRHITPEISREPAIKPRAKVNPFGNAKPREVLLQARGKDWRKMDFELEHRAVERPETQEEIALREEIRVLTDLSRQELGTDSQRTNGCVPDPSVKQEARLHTILEELRIKENQLQAVTMELDDKVRFSQKIMGRAGSQSGRNDVGRTSEMFERSGSRSSSRPGSRSGRSDAGSNYDSTERLESRRVFDASDRTNSLSEYGMWPRTGQVPSSRESSREAPETLSGRQDNRGFEPSLRPHWRRVTPEVGVADNYPQGGICPDVWTSSTDGSHDRSTGWRGQERGPYRGGARRF